MRLIFLLSTLALAPRMAAARVDEAAMRAAGCAVPLERLRAMPAKIGNAALPAALRAKLRWLGYAHPSRGKVALRPGTLATKDGKQSLRTLREKAGPPSTQAPLCPAMDPSRFIRGAGNGAMRSAAVAIVVAPLELWRAFSLRPSACGHARLQGAWWSLTDPRRLRKPAWRRRNGVCASWNALTHVVRCRLKPGAPLAIGPTESVTRQACSCDAAQRRRSGDGIDDSSIALEGYPADDSTLQVYVNLSAGAAALLSCDPPIPWN